MWPSRSLQSPFHMDLEHLTALHNREQKDSVVVKAVAHIFIIDKLHFEQHDLQSQGELHVQ